MGFYASSFIILLFSFLAQLILASHFKIGGVQPDLLLIFVVVYAYFAEAGQGLVAGFVAGFIKDLFSAQPLGVSAMSFVIVSYLAILLRRTVFPENVAVIAILVFLATVLQQIIYAGILFIIGKETPFLTFFLRIALPEALYNGLITPLFCLLVRRFIEVETEQVIG